MSSDAVPARSRAEVVLIGPVCAGKSTIGELLAGALGVPHIDLDHVAREYYAALGFSAPRFRALAERAGLMQATRDAEPAMLHAPERGLADHAACVLSLGAAHSHFLAPERLERAARALEPFRNVVLLLPHPDPARAVEVLRARCLGLGLPPWRDASGDLIERWVVDPCNRRLATRVVYTERRLPCETAEEIQRDLGLAAARA